jgi:hypothetical protein
VYEVSYRGGERSWLLVGHCWEALKIEQEHSMRQGLPIVSLIFELTSFRWQGGSALNDTLYYGQVDCFERVLAVNPKALMLIRFELTDGHNTIVDPASSGQSGKSFDQIMEMLPNGSIFESGCSSKDDWRRCASITDAWVNDTSVTMQLMLRQLDQRFPGTIFGVQLTQLSTGEWMYPHNIGSTYPDYSPAAQREFCEQAWPHAQGVTPSATCKVDPDPTAANGTHPFSGSMPTAQQRSMATFGTVTYVVGTYLQFVTADTAFTVHTCTL